MDSKTEEWVKEKLDTHSARVRDLELRLVKLEVKMNIITFLAASATSLSFVILAGLITKLFGGA